MITFAIAWADVNLNKVNSKGQIAGGAYVSAIIADCIWLSTLAANVFG